MGVRVLRAPCFGAATVVAPVFRAIDRSPDHVGQPPFRADVRSDREISYRRIRGRKPFVLVDQEHDPLLCIHRSAISRCRQ